MLTRKFRELLEARYALRATVCVGLDSALYKIPNRFKPKGATARVIQFAFNEWIINQTCDLRLAAYKANFGFYLAAGPEGLWALHDTIQYSHMVAPSIPFILDAKVGDIDNTNEEYGTGLFGFFEADAITVHNYLGHETMEPFLSRSDKGIFVLCRTSNKGAGEFQDRVVKEAFTEEPLY
jgi:orotidine-5'-phosphate decarboxylase